MALRGDVASYVLRVRRLRPGDRFLAFDPETRSEADVELLEPDGLIAQVRVGPLRPPEVAATRELILLQGLPKGDKLDAIVRDATELGATRILAVSAARSVVRLEGGRAALRRARWQRIAEEAARQSGRADPPLVLGPLSLAEATSSLPEGSRFAMDPGSALPLGDVLSVALSSSGALIFAVGPEGGLAEGELASLEASGFARVSMGPFVLRTETVAAALLGGVQILAGCTHP